MYNNVVLLNIAHRQVSAKLREIHLSFLNLITSYASALAAFLYPGYASYKTLSQRPASEAELEHWLMYWSVLGCVVGVEYLAEWLVSWYVPSVFLSSKR